MTTSLPSRLLIWTLVISEVFGTEIKKVSCAKVCMCGNLFVYLRKKKVGIFWGILHTLHTQQWACWTSAHSS